jgi:hypothetical protein
MSLSLWKIGGIHARRLENGAYHALQAVPKANIMKICAGNNIKGLRCHQDDIR